MKGNRILLAMLVLVPLGLGCKDTDCNGNACAKSFGNENQHYEFEYRDDEFEISVLKSRVEGLSSRVNYMERQSILRVIDSPEEACLPCKPSEPAPYFPCYFDDEGKVACNCICEEGGEGEGK